MELIKVNDFLGQEKIAIAGVSRQKGKFGNSIYKQLKKKGFNVVPLNPNMKTFDSDVCYHSIEELPDDIGGLLINTPAGSASDLIEQAKKKGIKQIWLQQGAESPELIDRHKNGAINLIHNECIFMYAKPIGFMHKIHRGINKLAGKYPA